MLHDTQIVQKLSKPDVGQRVHICIHTCIQFPCWIHHREITPHVKLYPTNSCSFSAALLDLFLLDIELTPISVESHLQGSS